MFKLRIGYLVSGIVTGLILLVSFIGSLPDGKLHIVFCDVGQGDAIYVRFPDSRDMLIDGGPNNRVLACLGRHMPFWDRELDLVVLTHPQRDHLQGLLAVFNSYGVNYFLRSNVANNTEGYEKLVATIAEKKIAEKFALRGERVDIGTSSLSVLWPSDRLMARATGDKVLGAATAGNINDFSLVLWLRYGNFDALLTGDADSRVEGDYIGQQLADDRVELLKVPHHGSKTGMTENLVRWLQPEIAVVSVGKNSYGHPAKEILQMLADSDIRLLRTDVDGEVEVVSDGSNWTVKTRKTNSN